MSVSITADEAMLYRRGTAEARRKAGDITGIMFTHIAGGGPTPP